MVHKKRSALYIYGYIPIHVLVLQLLRTAFIFEKKIKTSQNIRVFRMSCCIADIRESVHLGRINSGVYIN